MSDLARWSPTRHPMELDPSPRRHLPPSPMGRLTRLLLRPGRLIFWVIPSILILTFFWCFADQSSFHTWLNITKSRSKLPEFCYDPYRLSGYARTPKTPKSRSSFEAEWVVNNPNPSSHRRSRTEGKRSSVQQDFVLHSLVADLVAGDEPNWLRNRTVLFVGDSLDRNLVHFFSTEAFPGPAPHRFLTATTDPAFTEPATASHRIGLGQHRSLGFTLANWFIMSVDVEKPSVFFHSEEDEPQPIEARLPHFFLPTLGPVVSPNPEMVVFNSGLWDLVYRSEAAAYASRVDHAPARIVGGALTQAELAEHEQRMVRLIELLQAAFPSLKTRLVYRTMPDSSRAAEKNAMSRLRVRQLDEAHVRLIRRLNKVPSARPIDILDWANVSRSLTHEIADLVHFKPGKAQWLYAELVLNHLRRVVLGDNRETEWVDCQSYMSALVSSGTGPESISGSTSRSIFDRR
ncbi:hypothetical protein CROQUDRAFT_651989 [Cronartium quercuum f. sp. fusiforme G11]|uniref:Uncharacterized protein n=1 Tax=Cronartium quercuum f. sp. fusiforme G11 TaxID=708437 RepID=A0A9P6TFU0_9BASI|nr:hypothetical protein CROQUDRAFT_651989 [Cronartium quercuum f. sp. fusiforme G11]